MSDDTIEYINIQQSNNVSQDNSRKPTESQKPLPIPPAGIMEICLDGMNIVPEKKEN